MQTNLLMRWGWQAGRFYETRAASLRSGKARRRLPKLQASLMAGDHPRQIRRLLRNPHSIFVPFDSIHLRRVVLSRRLTAVLAADVVGYSRMMGADADGTLSSLRRLRTEVFGPSVAGHRGTVIKSMGDGWIVTFDSAVDAVTCAMRIQDKMSAEPDIRLRVGIHIGDITQEDEDVFGDGVNIAARLEALTQPGGVTISDAVFGTLDGTLRPAFDDTGEQALKNIARPIRVWSRGGAAVVARSAPGQKDSGFPKLHIKPVEVAGSEDALRQMADALKAVEDLVRAQWMKLV